LRFFSYQRNRHRNIVHKSIKKKSIFRFFFEKLLIVVDVRRFKWSAGWRWEVRVARWLKLWFDLVLISWWFGLELVLTLREASTVAQTLREASAVAQSLREASDQN
jgi:hypothetical protein